MIKLLKFSLVLSLTGLSACAIQRHHEWADDIYSRRSSAKKFIVEKKQHNVNMTKEELGYGKSQLLNEKQSLNLRRRLALSQLENSLESSEEKRQYYKYKSIMVSDLQRMYFLQLPSVNARERWIQSSKLIDKSQVYSDEMAEVIEKQNLVVGMFKKAVIESWGDPDVIEYAGNPVYGNERWKYIKLISSNNGFDKQIRMVYFEAGKVVGWESI